MLNTMSFTVTILVIETLLKQQLMRQNYPSQQIIFEMWCSQKEYFGPVRKHHSEVHETKKQNDCCLWKCAMQMCNLWKGKSSFILKFWQNDVPQRTRSKVKCGKKLLKWGKWAVSQTEYSKWKSNPMTYYSTFDNNLPPPN